MFRDQSRFITIYHGGGGNCHRLQRIKGDSRKLMGGDIRTLQRLIGGIFLPS